MENNLLNFGDASWLHELYDQAPVAIGIYHGEDHIIKLANPRMREIWGRSYEEVINKPLFEALPEVKSQGFEEIIAEVYSTGQPFEGSELPATLKRADKVEILYFNIKYNPLLDSRKNIIGIIQTATNVTDLVISRKKAERNEEILNLALEGGKIGTWYVDLVTGNTEKSIEYDKILGYDNALPDWNTESIFQHIIPEDLAIARKSYNEGLKNDQISCEVRVQWPDESIHWICIKGKTSFNLKRQPISLSGVIMDITEQKEIDEKERQLAKEQAAREEAERQKQNLERLFSDAPALICTLSGPEHTFNMVNAAYQQQLFPGRALKGKPILEALPEIEGQPFKAMLDKVFSTGETFIGNEVPLQFDRLSNGNLETGYFNFVYQAYRDLTHEIVGILVFAFEVTEQIVARRLAEESQRNLRLALEAGKMGTWHLDLDGGVALHSLEHDQIFGYELPAPDWGFEKFLDHVIPECRKEVEDAFKLAEKSGSLNLETRILTVDNNPKWIAIKGKTFFEDGVLLGMAGIVMDITERKEAEVKFKELSMELAYSNQELKTANTEASEHLESLSKANKQLKLINADLDNFIYTASHDLKAPISNIEGLMTMLIRNLSEEYTENGLVQKILASIETSIGRFKKTIEELTDIAKLQKTEDDISELDIAEIVNEVLLDLETTIQQTGATIEVKASKCHKINFSYKNLKSIVYNIISNAIKYKSPERDPHIIISCGDEEKGFISLTIKDNGLGIKQDDLKKIFVMYKRLHSHVEGTGIGLYLVKRIIDNAEGKIEVESEENVGTSFKVFLPLASFLPENL